MAAIKVNDTVFNSERFIYATQSGDNYIHIFLKDLPERCPYTSIWVKDPQTALKSIVEQMNKR